jgi:hypothetical protein
LTGFIFPTLLTRHTSHVTRHTSHVTRHTSHVTPHTSHLTPHTSHLRYELVISRIEQNRSRAEWGAGGRSQENDPQVFIHSTHTTHHTPHASHQTPHTTYHTPHTAHHTPHTTHHTSHFTNRTSQLTPFAPQVRHSHSHAADIIIGNPERPGSGVIPQQESRIKQAAESIEQQVSFVAVRSLL